MPKTIEQMSDIEFADTMQNISKDYTEYLLGLISKHFEGDRGKAFVYESVLKATMCRYFSIMKEAYPEKKIENIITAFVQDVFLMYKTHHEHNENCPDCRAKESA